MIRKRENIKSRNLSNVLHIIKFSVTSLKYLSRFPTYTSVLFSYKNSRILVLKVLLPFKCTLRVQPNGSVELTGSMDRCGKRATPPRGRTINCWHIVEVRPCTCGRGFNGKTPVPCSEVLRRPFIKGAVREENFYAVAPASPQRAINCLHHRRGTRSLSHRGDQHNGGQNQKKNEHSKTSLCGTHVSLIHSKLLTTPLSKGWEPQVPVTESSIYVSTTYRHYITHQLIVCNLLLLQTSIYRVFGHYPTMYFKVSF